MMEAGSFSIVPIEVVQDRRLTLWQTKVLVALFSFRNKTTNTVFPSRQVLAERTGLHVNNISKATTDLAELGWLVKTGQGGFSKATRYELQVPDLLDSKPQAEEQTTIAELTSPPLVDSTSETLADYTRGKEHTNEHTKEHMSGKPDDAAKNVLEHLNKKTGRKYHPVAANLHMINARIKEFSVEDCIAVIDMKVSEWMSDERMSQYLRPATLFNATNFASYQGMIGQSPLKMSSDIRDW
jgi:uncharacterized phage protein (TIGR02220 family)